MGAGAVDLAVREKANVAEEIEDVFFVRGHCYGRKKRGRVGGSVRASTLTQNSKGASARPEEFNAAKGCKRKLD
jgi:hypothetical protein